MATCRQVIAIRIPLVACSQYLNYSFGSMVKFGNKCYGGNEDGLFQIETGSDDVTASIDAYFKLYTTDFGLRNLKRMRSLFVRHEADGDLKFTVYNSEENAREYVLEKTYNGQLEKGSKVPVGRDGKGVHWSVRVDNIDGCDFSIDSMEALMLILKTTSEA